MTLSKSWIVILSIQNYILEHTSMDLWKNHYSVGILMRIREVVFCHHLAMNLFIVPA